MIVKTEYADISLAGSPMRTFVAAPNVEGEYPGTLLSGETSAVRAQAS
jgi:hypothetical protein